MIIHYVTSQIIFFTYYVTVYMELHTLERSSGLKDKARRIGRGNATKGNYAGKWLKGQKARSGKWSKIPAYFEWGQTPLYMRIPKKKWFKRYFKLGTIVQAINVGMLNDHFSDGDTISPAILESKWLIKNSISQVKILWGGSCDKTFVFEWIELFSKNALTCKK